jgi:hypothetical protein
VNKEELYLLFPCASISVLWDCFAFLKSVICVVFGRKAADEVRVTTIFKFFGIRK